ncbi:hypothetical protein N7G274_004631 [Stereocaulon virgatum]|uniref:Uncharacterized protein n=1 Tax=Stereocaulon virgatum TaxID=373712 RepID=A0ABR4ADC5_9LECA
MYSGLGSLFIFTDSYHSMISQPEPWLQREVFNIKRFVKPATVILRPLPYKQVPEPPMLSSMSSVRGLSPQIHSKTPEHSPAGATVSTRAWQQAFRLHRNLVANGTNQLTAAGFDVYLLLLSVVMENQRLTDVLTK